MHPRKLEQTKKNQHVINATFYAIEDGSHPKRLLLLNRKETRKLKLYKIVKSKTETR